VLGTARFGVELVPIELASTPLILTLLLVVRCRVNAERRVAAA